MLLDCVWSTGEHVCLQACNQRFYRHNISIYIHMGTFANYANGFPEGLQENTEAPRDYFQIPKEISLIKIPDSYIGWNCHAWRRDRACMPLDSSV